MKGYMDGDKATRHQKALPLLVYRTMKRDKVLHLNMVIGQLCEGAFFFAMHSCEYSKVEGDRKTKLLTVRNIRFFQGTRELHKIGRYAKFILLAQTVAITFESTKNGEKNVDITHHRTNKDLCPVRVWGDIVLRILKYPKTTVDSPVNTVMVGALYVK